MNVRAENVLRFPEVGVSRTALMPVGIPERRSVADDETIRGALNDFVGLAIRLEDYREFAERYGVFGAEQLGTGSEGQGVHRDWELLDEWRDWGRRIGGVLRDILLGLEPSSPQTTLRPDLQAVLEAGHVEWRLTGEGRVFLEMVGQGLMGLLALGLLRASQEPSLVGLCTECGNPYLGQRRPKSSFDNYCPRHQTSARIRQARKRERDRKLAEASDPLNT